MPNRQPEPHYLAVGRIVRPHGVRGEVRVEVLTDYPDHLVTVEVLYVGEKRQPVKVVSARLHQKVALIRFEGVADRTVAEGLRGSFVYVTMDAAVPLSEDEYYEYQIEGLAVVTDEGEPLGEIVEIFTAPGANDVLVVHGPLGELLIPVIEDVVVEIDPDAGCVVIHPLPGLLPDHS